VPHARDAERVEPALQPRWRPAGVPVARGRGRLRRSLRHRGPADAAVAAAGSAAPRSQHGLSLRGARQALARRGRERARRSSVSGGRLCTGDLAAARRTVVPVRPDERRDIGGPRRHGAFPGIYALALPEQPFLDRRTLLLTTQWRSVQTALAVYLTTGDVCGNTEQAENVSEVVLACAHGAPAAPAARRRRARKRPPVRTRILPCIGLRARALGRRLERDRGVHAGQAAQRAGHAVRGPAVDDGRLAGLAAQPAPGADPCRSGRRAEPWRRDNARQGAPLHGRAAPPAAPARRGSGRVGLSAHQAPIHWCRQARPRAGPGGDCVEAIVVHPSERTGALPGILWPHGGAPWPRTSEGPAVHVCDPLTRRQARCANAGVVARGARACAAARASARRPAARRAAHGARGIIPALGGLPSRARLRLHPGQLPVRARAHRRAAAARRQRSSRAPARAQGLHGVRRGQPAGAAGPHRRPRCGRLPRRAGRRRGGRRAHARRTAAPL